MNMQHNRRCFKASWLTLALVLGIISVSRALPLRYETGVNLGNITWTDPDPDHQNQTNCATIPACGCSASAWAQMTACPDQSEICGTFVVTTWGSVIVETNTSGCDYYMCDLTVVDPTKPGGVTITASVSGVGFTGVAWDCGFQSFQSVGVGKYTPDGSTCSTCGGSGGSGSAPAAASAGVDNGSVEFRLNLGKSSVIDGAGYLWLYADLPSTNLARPTSLEMPYAGINDEVISNTAGTIVQVMTPQGLFNIASNNNYQYQIQCFYSNNVTAKTGGLYGTNGFAFDTWTVQNPDSGTASNRLWITEQPLYGTSRQFQYTYVAANLEWDLVQPDGQTTNSTWQGAINSTTTNYYRQTTAAGSIASYGCKTYQYVAATRQRLLLQEINGTGPSAQTNTFSYYTSGGGSNKLQRADYANGNWKYCTYDSYGRILKEYSAYNNSAPPSSGEPDPTVNHCKMTTYVYDVATINSIDACTTNDPLKSRYEYDYVPVQGISGWQSQLVGEKHTLAAIGSGSIESFRTFINPGVDQQFLETDTKYAYSQWYQLGKTIEIDHPDLTVTYFWYPDQYTTVENDPDNTQTTSIVDQLGDPLSTTKVDRSTGVILSQLIYTYTNSSGVPFDQLLRGYDVTDLAGRTTSYRYSDCCASYTVTDPDGCETVYADDLLKRPVANIIYRGSSSGIMTSNTLDGAGRILMVQRTGTDGTVITNRQTQYDLAGRIICQTNALGGFTTTTNVVLNSQLVITNTDAYGGTRVETYYRDGRLQTVTGSAVHPVEYLYGAEQDVDGTWREYTQTIHLKEPGDGTNEWTKTYVNSMGKAFKTVYSAANAPYSQSESFYNSVGQLWEQVDPDGVTNFFVYGNNGDLNQSQVQYSITALSATALGITDYDTLIGTYTSLEGGPDHVKETIRSVVQGVVGGQPDLVRTDTCVWTPGESDNQGTLIASSETATAGTNVWQIQFAVADGSVAVTNETVTCYASPARTTTLTAPDGSTTVNSYSYGLLTTSTRYDSTPSQIGETTYAYDGHGRQNQVTDFRDGTTTNGYNAADLVTVVTTPLSGTGGSAETTSTLYDKLLRPSIVTQPDNTTVTNSYLLTGELGQQSGSRVYPVAYTYDYAGRMQTMTTWTNFGAGTGPSTTAWNYDPYRGWLTSKIYTNGQGPSYTYTPAGRLFTRTWMRGVTTTYSYDNAGELCIISYSDGSPSVTNAYDNLGRLSSVAKNGMTDSLTYNLAGQLLEESFAGGPLGGLAVTNGYDNFLRRTNLTALGATLLSQTAYGYDKASRLATVSDGTNSASYIYLANSPLVIQITFKTNTATRMTTTKAYDYLDRLTQISSAPSAAYVLPLTYNYNYNSANQRTKDTLADGSYWVYGYDSLGQVTNGCKYFADGTPVAGQQFGYAFDTVGNRTQTLSGGDTNGANLRVANYLANSRNQVTQRDVPPYVDIMGASILTNAVSINGQTAYRKQEYYRQQLAANNANSALWTNIIVTGGLSVTGNVYVAQAPEHFLYDADGNLTNDGRWAYSWDPENRLVQMTVNTNVGPLYQLKFAYDAKGRRIQKTVVSNSVPVYTNNFLYDDWNLVAETAPNGIHIRTYVWGSDLSGTMQGAGGVGGLLEVSYYGASTTNCFPAFDGNGNLASLVNAADGTVFANYEYGPFGEVIRQTGPLAKVNPFRFSTKYQDDESDLLYYGYRYYKASTGTWVSRDPLGEPGFELVANNPQAKKKPVKVDAATAFLNLLGIKDRFSAVKTSPEADQNTVNLYVFVGNDPIVTMDAFGLLGVPNVCLQPLPISCTSSLCDSYGDETYPGFGVNLKCFCKCAGDSQWSKQVRGCLACAHAHGVGVEVAHAECYANATLLYGAPPVSTLGQCFLKCGGKPPIIIAGF